MEALKAMSEHSRARGATLEVARGLAFYAEQGTDLAWAGNDLLAAWARCSTRQVQRSLTWLENSGEIVRQPGLPGRRTYLLTPGTAQQPLPGMGRLSSVADTAMSRGDTQGRRGDTHARAALEPVEPVNGKPPLAPPQAGGDGQASDLRQQQTAPRNARPARAAGARRRRRRAAAQTLPMSGPCPLGDPPADSGARELLEKAWAALDARLRAEVGEVWELWRAGVHLHSVSEYFELAVPPHSAGWVPARYGSVIARAAIVPVRFVACEGMGAR